MLWLQGFAPVAIALRFGLSLQPKPVMLLRLKGS